MRITHLPTGTVAECQDGRSQHKNKAQAMEMLYSKLLIEKQDKQKQETADERKSLIGSGDRSERIRTYNYPQGRLTDHRINLTLYKLDSIMEGDIDSVIDELRKLMIKMVNDINNITIREILNDDVMVSKKDIMYCLSYCLNKNESFVVTNQNYVLTDLEYKKLEKLIFDLRSGKPFLTY